MKIGWTREERRCISMDHRVRASKLWKMNGGIQGWILGKDSLLKIDRFQSRALFHRVPGVSGRGTLIDTRGDTITKFYSPSNIRGGEYILSSKPIKISKCAKQISLSRLNIVHVLLLFVTRVNNIRHPIFHLNFCTFHPYVHYDLHIIPPSCNFH